jgi:hypothetical protein
MTNDIAWKWFDGEYRIHCTNPVHYRQIVRWKGCRLGSTYYFPNGEMSWDVTIPEECLDGALSLVTGYETSETERKRTNRRLNRNEL